MDENVEIHFVDGRNADHRTQHPNTSQRGPVSRTVYLAPRPGQGAIQPQVMYGPPIGASATFLGRMSTGQLIDLVAQIFAALMPLPAAPVSTSDAGTDVSNLITYQSALASYAKRDEQVRTLGNLITKLVG